MTTRYYDPVTQGQYDRLKIEPCPAGLNTSTWSRHELYVHLTKRWRDLRKLRYWFRCKNCDLLEERQYTSDTKPRW